MTQGANMTTTRRSLLAAAALPAAVLPGLAQAAGTAKPLPATDLPCPMRDSRRNRSGRPGLQWTTYGYNYPNDSNIPEDVWKANIDWFIGEFGPLGYDTICTDGWIESSQRINANGYILSLNDAWQHDWPYWIAYLRERGMALSLYYNPFWVTQSARLDRSIKVAGRPDIAVADLTHDWDYFTKGQLYWVDWTRDGAREYCQNYVRYFKALGVSRLRVDFLSYYEMGYDEGAGPVNQAPHGREAYLALLGWIHEAAGPDLEISLVMPNMLDHGSAERAHGDMFRVDRDAFKGGWEWLSGGRKTWYPLFSQWLNPFEGFTGWSDIGGPGLIGMDGDFLIASAFANDDERRTAVTLFTMAGSPICVADTAAMAGPALAVFRNTEVIALNKQALAGKPVYNCGRPFSHAPEARDTERWIGQLADSCWIIALFNRSDAVAQRSIAFRDVLGLDGPVAVRNLWERTDLGSLSGFAAAIPAHGCVLLKLGAPVGPRRYASHVAGWSGRAAFDNTTPGYTGQGYVSGLARRDSAVSFAVDAGEGGKRKIRIRYLTNDGAPRRVRLAALSADGAPDHGQTFSFSGTHGQWKDAETSLPCHPGRNVVVVAGEHDDLSDLAVDWIEVG